MNWGGFGDGFSKGFNNGIATGKTINELIKQGKLEDIRAQGIAEATAARDRAVASSVRENGIDAATPATTPNAAPSSAAPKPELTSAPQATPARAAPASYPAAEDPVAADQPAAPAAPNQAPPRPQQPAPVDPALQGAPPPVPKEPAPASTPVATPMPISPVQTTGSVPKDAPAAPAAQGIATPQKRFSVNGKGFDTREEALDYAKKNPPSIMDYMSKTLVPKMQEAYLAQGDIEKADAWNKWAKEKKNEKNMETWGNAYRAAQAGDMEGAANHVFELYKGFDDGITPLSKETVKDKDGNITGFNVRLKTDATGEERTQFVDKKALTEMGLSALSPPAMFEQVYKRQAAADQLNAKARIDAENDARTAKREEARDNRTADRQDARDARTAVREDRRADKQHGYKLEELATGEQLKEAGATRQERAKIQSKIDILKENGYTPDAVRELIPHMVGGDGYKKTTSPEEARRLLMTERIKDPIFSRKTPAEQKSIIDQDMTTVYGAGSTGPAKPSASPAAPAKKGTPYLTPDGKVVYR